MKGRRIIYSTKWLAYTAMMTALVIATGFIPPVPTPAGRIYWVDGMVLIAAFLIDPLAAFICGGVGTLIYDVLQSPSMMLTSLLTHGLQGALVSALVHLIFPKKREALFAAVSAVCGAVIVIAGYFLHRTLFYGLPVAIASVPRNILQEVIGISIAVTVCYATTLKRQLEKSGLLPDFTRNAIDKCRRKKE